MEPENVQQQNTPPNSTVESLSTNDAKIMPSKSTESTGRYCWVCFATDEDDENAEWVQPCNCRGTTKWVRYILNSS